MQLLAATALRDLRPRILGDHPLKHKFLQTIDGEVPGHLDVHLVLDNSSAHKTPKIQRWLAQHPRFVLNFTPTSSSWLNLVERWFGELTTKLLRRGAHPTVRALNADIRTRIKPWNENPRPVRVDQTR
jgi:transposase